MMKVSVAMKKEPRNAGEHDQTAKQIKYAFYLMFCLVHFQVNNIVIIK